MVCRWIKNPFKVWDSIVRVVMDEALNKENV